MKRLLLVSNEFPPGPGGVGTHAFQVAEQLTSRDWTVEVVACQDYMDSAEIERFNRAQRFAVQSFNRSSGLIRKQLARRRQLADAIRRQRPDVILGTGSRLIWHAAWAARKFNIPCALVVHGSEINATNWERLPTRHACQRVDLVISVSRFTRDQMHRHRIRPRRETVITNGANPAEYRLLPTAERDRIRSGLGVAGGGIIVTVGNVSERKGQETVIRALPEILRQVPDTHYLIVGKPTLETRLGALAEELGVRDRVRFLGRLPTERLNEILNAADLFAMTSVTTASGDCEGFGIAAVEAALCGCPAVVSANTGLVEAIEEGVTGFAVPQRDHAGVARAALKILRDAALRAQMSAAAVERARTQTWDACGERFDAALKELIR